MIRWIGSHIFYPIRLHMNVLDAPQADQIEFRNCKLHYLSIENKLLALKHSTLQNIICIYKDIINEVSSPSSAESGHGTEAKLKKLLGKAEKYTQRCLDQYKKVSQTEQFVSKLEEPYLDPEFFPKIVKSYESTISELRAQIKHRELTLQELQIDGNHPLKRKNDTVKENKAARKAIQSYDIYQKVSEKCKIEIMQLKTQKNKLQAQNLLTLQENKKYKNREESQANNEETAKTIKKVGMEQNPRSLDDLSLFEKTVLVYKKKKLLNQILERKVADIKRKVIEKQQCNQVLKKRLEGEAWDMNSILPPSSRNVQQEPQAYLSMLNSSMKTANEDFSVDISKILPDSVKTGIESEKTREESSARKQNIQT